MQKWEYMLVGNATSLFSIGDGVYYISPNSKMKKFSGKDIHGEQVINLLNQLGDQGWEVAGIISTFNNMGNYNNVWTLKRPKNE